MFAHWAVAAASCRRRGTPWRATTARSALIEHRYSLRRSLALQDNQVSEVKPHFHRKRSWRHVMRATESGDEVIQRFLGHKINRRKGANKRSPSLIAISTF
jgi:hypothetical protein